MSEEQRLHPSRRDLTNGSVLGHMVRLSLPMGWGILAIISFSLVDTWFISRLGTDQLAAIGFTMPVTMFVFNVIFALSIAMSSVVARRIGASGKGPDVSKIVAVGLGMVVVAALICAVIGHGLMRPIFTAMGAGEDVFQYIEDYMVIWLYGSVFLGIPIVANAAIRGAGDAVRPAMVMTSVAVVNAILSPLLIFGYLGFPRLEMQGAALSTVISYIISMVLALSILHWREGMVSFCALWSRQAWALGFKPLIVIAVPVAVASTILPVLGAVLNSWIAEYGAAAVAGFGVAVRIETFMLIPVMALGAGIAPLAGQNWGMASHEDDEKRKKACGRLAEILSKSSWFCVIFGVASALFLVLNARLLASLFTQDEQALLFASAFLQIVPIGYAALYYVQVNGSVFNAVGKPVQALALNAVKAFFFILPFVALGRLWGDVQGMYIGIMAAHILAGLIMWVMVKRMQRSALAKSV